MLKLSKIRDLNLRGTSPQRPDYVYSASGLVEINDEWIVVADDEFHLAVFPKDPSMEGRWVRIFSGDLPEGYKDRKKRKPDLEALTVMPPSKLAPNGALLVVPSMSESHRTRGALIPCDDDRIGESIPIDYSDLYSALSSELKELNIEAVVVTEQAVKLFHRGSGKISKSAIVDLEVSRFLQDIHNLQALTANSLKQIREYDLGQLNHVNLMFTDAASLPDDRMVFLAAAEDTTNAHEDGVIAGSAVGILNSNGDVICVEHIEGSLKLEGICAKVGADQLELHMVADSDDQTMPSALFASTWRVTV